MTSRAFWKTSSQMTEWCGRPLLPFLSSGLDTICGGFKHLSAKSLAFLPPKGGALFSS